MTLAFNQNTKKMPEVLPRNESPVPTDKTNPDSKSALLTTPGGSTPSMYASENLNRMLDGDSLYMQQAKQQGLNTAASRGLLNSSISAGAAQQSAINAAAPIAQSDAQSQLTKTKIDYDKWKLGKDVQANLQGKYLKSIDGIMNDASLNINEIETADGLNQEQKNLMIKNTIARRDADMAFLRDLYTAMPVWSNNWTDFPNMPDAPGVAL